jgi:hypothetical protein
VLAARSALQEALTLPLPYPSLFAFAAATDLVPPEWRTLPRVAFSDLVEAIDSKAASAVEVWADRDPSVYWPPQPIHQPFPGKRCVATLADGSRVWADVPIPEMEARAQHKPLCAVQPWGFARLTLFSLLDTGGCDAAADHV